MNRQRHPVKYALVTAAIIGCLGVLTVGGQGARAIREASAFLGIGGTTAEPTLQTCEAAVRTAFDAYAATLTPIAQESVTDNAGIIAAAEAALTDGVATAPCPSPIEATRQSFVTANRYYVTLLQDIAGGSRTTADPLYQEAQAGANQAWRSLLTALRIGQ